MYHIVYKTTNIVNGMIYIGVHSTSNINDGYLGSGIYLRKAITKYGKESFKRDVLYVFASKEDAYQKESDIVTPEFVQQDNVYNIALGGESPQLLSGYKKHVKNIKDIKDIKDVKPCKPCKPCKPYKPTSNYIDIKCGVDDEHLFNRIWQGLKSGSIETFELRWALAKLLYNGINDIVGEIDDKINNQYTFKKGVKLAKRLNEFIPISITGVSK